MSRGFTMIEMMVVIGVIAILALMALPNYSERIIRDQVVEALPLAEIAKPPLALAWAKTQATRSFR
ncbi:MAG: pilin [Betaproteobacteria bacterium]